MKLTKDGDLVILHLPVPDEAGATALRTLRAQAPAVPVIVVGEDVSLASPSDAFELGAHECFQGEDPTPQRLLASIGLALGTRRDDTQLRYLRHREAEEASLHALIGESPPMNKLKARVRQICHRMGTGPMPPILIQGETGTGKGVLAKTLHYSSPRRNGPFVTVNCAAIPHALLESELFGHERGAFTNAHAAKPGLFETADGGTILLDEIASMPLDLQSKLLLACEDRQIRRLGSNRSVNVDVQIVAAAHQELPELVRERAFRRDLYHRLSVLVLRLPPLRERGTDKLLLAERFVAKTCARYGIGLRELSPDARALVSRATWPGNVRELKNQIERLILLGDQGPILATDFEIIEDHALNLELTPSCGLRVKLPIGGMSLDLIERAVIEEALDKCEGNVSRAARFLDITRQTMMYRIKKHGIRSESNAPI